MRVVKAKDYGYRVVITVVSNPDEPEWVHGSDKAPANHTGNYPPEPKKVSCGLCRSNWQYREFIWGKDELMTVDKDTEQPRRKTPDELMAEIRQQLKPVLVVDMPSLVGRAI